MRNHGSRQACHHTAVYMTTLLPWHVEDFVFFSEIDIERFEWETSRVSRERVYRMRYHIRIKHHSRNWERSTALTTQRDNENAQGDFYVGHDRLHAEAELTIAACGLWESDSEDAEPRVLSTPVWSALFFEWMDAHGYIALYWHAGRHKRGAVPATICSEKEQTAMRRSLAAEPERWYRERVLRCLLKLVYSITKGR